MFSVRSFYINHLYRSGKLLELTKHLFIKHFVKEQKYTKLAESLTEQTGAYISKIARVDEQELMSTSRIYIYHSAVFFMLSPFSM